MGVRGRTNKRNAPAVRSTGRVRNKTHAAGIAKVPGDAATRAARFWGFLSESTSTSTHCMYVACFMIAGRVYVVETAMCFPATHNKHLISVVTSTRKMNRPLGCYLYRQEVGLSLAPSKCSIFGPKH